MPRPVLRSPFSAPLAALAALALLAVPAAAQGKLETKPHEDLVNGFRFKPFQKWNQVPPQPGEENKLCTYADSVIDFKENVRYPLEIEVLKIDRVGAETGGEADEGGEEGLSEEEVFKRKIAELRRREQPKSYRELMLQQYGKELKFAVDGKKARYGKQDVLEYEFSSPSQGGRAKFFHFAAVISASDRELVLHFVLPDIGTVVKDWRSSVERCAKTFELIDKEKPATAGANGGTPDDGAITPFDLKKAELEKQYASMPEWKVEESPCKRYVILIHNDDRKFVAEIKKRISSIRDVLEEEYPVLPDRPITAISILRVCASRGEYQQYGGPAGSAGYWSAHHQELVIYDDKDINRNNTWGTLNHEAFHQYIFYRCGEISPHSWFNEGTGDYYAGYKLKGAAYKVDKFDWRLGTVQESMKAAKEGGKAPAFVPLKDLISYSQREYYSNPDICYSLGWSFVYFLKEGSKGGRWKAEWSKILPTYLDTITQTKDPEAANKAAFDGIDLAELEQAWINFKW
ncbi:MAG: hypothetical protein IPN34_06500 [Planctomycetes bacterium]|nr:hypothetical protein [Planctomycetota bacterium]